MAHSTEPGIIAPSMPETTQVSDLDPNNSIEMKNDLSCTPEKTHEPDSPKDVKREIPPAVEYTISKLKSDGECTRERLKKHRQEMAGRVWIPDLWGQENFLKEWNDCGNVFERSLVPKGLVSARDALVEECRRSANSKRPIRIQKSC